MSARSREVGTVDRKPITATELLKRQAEWAARFPQPDFEDILDAIIKIIKEKNLG